MLRIVFCTMALLLFGISTPAQAFVNDPLQVETADGGGSGFDDPLSGYCADCCSGGVSDSGCCDACDCQCGFLGCNSYSMMSRINVPDFVNSAILSSISSARAELKSVDRGAELHAVFTKNSERLAEIYKSNPKLADRVAKGLVTYWPYDMWINMGEKAQKVSPEAMQELRFLVTAVADADRKLGAGALSKTIDTEVLPYLTRDLVNQPYHKAFGCFVRGQSCK